MKTMLSSLAQAAGTYGTGRGWAGRWWWLIIAAVVIAFVAWTSSSGWWRSRGRGPTGAGTAPRNR